MIMPLGMTKGEPVMRSLWASLLLALCLLLGAAVSVRSLHASNADAGFYPLKLSDLFPQSNLLDAKHNPLYWGCKLS